MVWILTHGRFTCSYGREQMLELCIRGGKRETIHKGPLRVLRVGKDAGVRVEFFYIFNDVVSTEQSCH